MSPALIHKTFDQLLQKGSKGRQLRRTIGMSSSQCCYLRHRIAHYNDVRLQTKMKWLQKAGYDIGSTDGFSRREMVAFGRFCGLKSNKKYLAEGYEAMLERWENQQRRKALLEAKK